MNKDFILVSLGDECLKNKGSYMYANMHLSMKPTDDICEDTKKHNDLNKCHPFSDTTSEA